MREVVARARSETIIHLAARAGVRPPIQHPVVAHMLRVKVDRGGTEVRSGSGYCNVRPKDILAGRPIEKDLEARASVAAPVANIGRTLEAPSFYTALDEARVNLAMEIPSNSIGYEKVKGKYHADVDILGIAYKPDNSVGALFSDEVTLDLEKDEWKKFTETPMHYQNQLREASIRLDSSRREPGDPRRTESSAG